MASQEATIRTGHGKTDWFQIGKEVHHGKILSPCLFKLHAEYIICNARLVEAQAGIQLARRNISNLIPIPKKGNAKECSNYRTIALISHASKVMLKILQARLLQYVNRELPDVQAGSGKGRGTRDQIANIRWIIEKAREF